jgi:hypothetical protein
MVHCGLYGHLPLRSLLGNPPERRDVTITRRRDSFDAGVQPVARQQTSASALNGFLSRCNIHDAFATSGRLSAGPLLRRGKIAEPKVREKETPTPQERWGDVGRTGWIRRT